ncbi:MAG: hypothetical protein WD334_07130 [Chitinophagales bacterium]
MGEIYSIGKKFDRVPKAVHVHVEIENESGKLLPGMYVRGQILTGSAESYVLPQSAVTRDGDHYVAFIAEKEMKQTEELWSFIPIRVVSGTIENEWIAVDFMDDINEKTLFAMNNAYYLLAELNKGEGGGHHH